MNQTSIEKSPIPPVRKPEFDPGRDLPHYWLNGRAFDTYFANTLHLMFPDGERFFIRSVGNFTAGLSDPVLKARVRGFLGQEVQHGIHHEVCWDILREQGYPVDGFLCRFRKYSFQIIEPWTERFFGKRMNLAATAAMEHCTAVLAEIALSSDWFRDTTPGMRDLMTWHSCEEIEHKDVAFDVLRANGGGYSSRVLGMGMAISIMSMVFAMGFLFCIRHDREWRRRRWPRLLFKEIPGFLFRFRRAPGLILKYLAPNFHPNNMDNRELARAAMPV